MDTIESQIDQEMNQQSPPSSDDGLPPQLVMGGGQHGVDPIAQGIDQEMNESEFGTLPQQALTAVEGAAKGFAGPVATGFEKFLSNSGLPELSPERQVHREEANPWIHGGSEAAGFVGGALTGTGEARVLSEVGHGAVPIANALGIGGPGAGVFSKIGSSAVRGAVENGLFQVGDETSKLIQGRPSDMVEQAIPNIGLAAAIGGTFGAGAGGVSALWKATGGTKAGALLNAVADRVGGIEGASVNPVDEMVAKTGMELAPEIRASLSNDRAVQELARTLNQSDSTNSGREFQASLKKFHEEAGSTITEALGKTPDSVPDSFDTYSAGKKLGESLADEVAEKIDPLSKQYNAFAEKYSEVPLEPSIEKRQPELKSQMVDTEKKISELQKDVMAHEYGENPEVALSKSEELIQSEQKLADLKRESVTPGTTDILANKINELASEEGWVTSPSSDIMKLVNQVTKEVPLQENLKNLSDFIIQVGNNSSKDPLNGPLRRAGGMIKNILRDTESDMIAKHVGEEGGEEAIAHYRKLQSEWRGVSQLKDALDDRLHLRGSTTGYAKQIRAMANDDAESLFRKLSGKNDAHLIDFLQTNFPKAAESLRDAHLDKILSAAKEGDGTINAGKVIRALDNKAQFSPQLKAFVGGPNIETVDSIGEILEQLKDPNYNWSNTQRTSKLMEYVPATAVGMATMLLGHNPLMAAVLGGMTKYIARDAPDAVRLGMLKWLGSNKPINPGAFKSMVDFIHTTIQGNDAMSKATKALFSGSSKVLPAHLMPSDKKLEKLDEHIKNSNINTASVEQAGHGVGYYMQNHGIATTATLGNAVQTLSALRPTTVRKSPLDPEIKPSALKQAKYQRQLTIAEQPLAILHYCAQGQLTNEDVSLCRHLYPGLVDRMTQQLTQNMVDHLSKGKEVPHEIKLGLSKLLGQPLVSSMQPATIAANQQVFAVANQHQQAMEKGTKPSVVGMRDIKAAGRLSLGHSDDGES